MNPEARATLKQAEAKLNEASDLLLEVFEGIDGWGPTQVSDMRRVTGRVQTARSNVARALLVLRGME